MILTARPPPIMATFSVDDIVGTNKRWRCSVCYNVMLDYGKRMYFEAVD
jgi:hypothetical protein